MDGDSKQIELKSDSEIKKYLYLTSFSINEEDLYNSEMKAVFGEKFSAKNHRTSKFTKPSTSVFIRGYIEILYEFSTIDEIIRAIKNSVLNFEKYKIKYIKTEEKIDYDLWIKAIRDIGTSIIGEFALHEPKVELALIRDNNNWIFGKHFRNNDEWKLRRQKPFNYSHALDVRLAKSILNIGIDNDYSLTVVDPCCGIGTVVTEGKVMGLNIYGYDINPLVVEQANANLEFFGFKKIIKTLDIHKLEKKYDLAILDIPYGQFSTITHENQILLISKTRKITKKAVIVSMDDMSDDIKNCGFSIIRKILLPKTNSFSRYITVCN